MKKISAAEFDRRFDAGEDMSAVIDWRAAKPLKGAAKGKKPASAAKSTRDAAKKTTPLKPQRKTA